MVDSAYWTPSYSGNLAPATKVRNSWDSTNPITSINDGTTTTWISAWRREGGEHDMGDYGDDEWYQMDWYHKFLNTGQYDRILGIGVWLYAKRDAGDTSTYRAVFLSSDSITTTSTKKFFSGVTHIPSSAAFDYYNDTYTVPNTSTSNSMCDLDCYDGEFTVRLYCPVIENKIFHDDEIMFGIVNCNFSYVPLSQLYSTLTVTSGLPSYNGVISYEVQRAANSNEYYWISHWKTYISANGYTGTYNPLSGEMSRSSSTASHSGFDTQVYYIKCIVENAEETAWGTLAGAAFAAAYVVKPVTNVSSSISSIATINWDSQTYDKEASQEYYVYYKKWHPGDSVPDSWQASVKEYDVPVGAADHPTTRTITTDGWFALENDYQYLFMVKIGLLSTYYSTNSNLSMSYYLQNAPVITDVDTSDSSSPIDNVEDDYTINLYWTPTNDASYGSNKTVHPVSYTGMNVFYHATDSTPSVSLDPSQYDYVFINSGEDSDACTVTVQNNGYYGIQLKYDQSYTASYSGQYSTDGASTILSTIKYFRVAVGWQGTINEKTNPGTIGGKQFLTIGGTVNDMEDRDLNPDGDPVF